MKPFYTSKTLLASLATGMLIFSQGALSSVYQFNWTGQVAGFSASGQFSFDGSQAYTDNIVREDDLDSFDVSFFDPNGTLLKTYKDNHQNFDDFNFAFNTNSMEILQSGKFADPGGLNIGEKTSDGSGGYTGLALWSRSKDTSPALMHIDDWSNEFGFPLGYGSHEDVSFYTRTTQQLIDTGKMGQYYLDNGTYLGLNELGRPIQVSAVPLPSAVLLFSSSLLFAGSFFRRRALTGLNNI